jgi:hypothetical protein
MKLEAALSSETSVVFTGLHGVISQKIEIFVVTALRVSNNLTGFDSEVSTAIIMIIF